VKKIFIMVILVALIAGCGNDATKPKPILDRTYDGGFYTIALPSMYSYEAGENGSVKITGTDFIVRLSGVLFDIKSGELDKLSPIVEDMKKDLIDVNITTEETKLGGFNALKITVEFKEGKALNYTIPLDDLLITVNTDLTTPIAKSESFDMAQAIIESFQFKPDINQNTIYRIIKGEKDGNVEPPPDDNQPPSGEAKSYDGSLLSFKLPLGWTYDVQSDEAINILPDNIDEISLGFSVMIVKNFGLSIPTYAEQQRQALGAQKKIERKIAGLTFYTFSVDLGGSKSHFMYGEKNGRMIIIISNGDIGPQTQDVIDTLHFK